MDEHDRLVARYILHRDSDGVEQTISLSGMPRNNMLFHALTNAARNVSGPPSAHSTMFWDRDNDEPSISYLYVDGS